MKRRGGPRKYEETAKLSISGERKIIGLVEQAVKGTGMSRSEAFFQGVQLWLSQRQSSEEISAVGEKS